MANDTQIIVVGSHSPGLFMRVKRIPQAGETVMGWDFHEPKDGGKGSNQAIAAALLGGKVSFVGCVGRDRVGQDGEQWMQEAGVETTWLCKHETVPTSIGFILLDDEGVPAMVSSYGANSMITKEQIDQAYSAMPSAKVMLTQFEIPVEIALYAAEQAKMRGMISIVNTAPATQMDIKKLKCASILVPNETEAKVLLGMKPNALVEPADLVKEVWKNCGAPIVIITLGKYGAIGIDGNGTWCADPIDVPVVDTSGAGDVFCAGLAVSLNQGKDIRTASSWACSAASLSVMKSGTIPAYPSIKDVDEYMLRTGEKT